MATHRRKEMVVEARQHDGPRLTVVSHAKGEQVAHPGDYLLGTEKGHVTVVPKAEFERDFEAVGEDVLDDSTVKRSGVDPVAYFSTEDDLLAYCASYSGSTETIRYTVGDDPEIRETQVVAPDLATGNSAQ